MSLSPDERRELIERTEASALDQMIGWGMERYERVFRTLAVERAAIEDTHRRVLRNVTEEDPIP